MLEFPKDPKLRELIAIRKLLTLALLKLKIATQDQVAEIIGIDRSEISRQNAPKKRKAASNAKIPAS